MKDYILAPSLIPPTHSLLETKLSQSSLPHSLHTPVSTRDVESLLADSIKNASIDDLEDPLFVADLGEVERQYHRFRSLLPRVEPFFAIKCNPDPMVIKTLLQCGTGFDCASKAEIQTVLDLGADPSRIIYANPCKQASHIRYAASKNVGVMTFDNADELYKVKRCNPGAQMVLRILADDSKSLCKFGVKFGASIQSVPSLLQLAKDLSLQVIGISFHVGSGCFDASAFSDAVVLARKAFDIASGLGFNFTLLDVGGGFPGYNQPDQISFVDIAAKLGPTIDALFPPSVRVIAEPGRYFVCSAYTLAVNVTAKRIVSRDVGPSNPPPDQDGTEADQHPSFMYYINDGMYGSFNCIIFDHAKPLPKVLIHSGEWKYSKDTTSLPEFVCSIWGPTCDSMDCITRSCMMPELNVGDWMYFDGMGAYTNAAASCFNGFRKSRILYTRTRDTLA